MSNIQDNIIAGDHFEEIIDVPLGELLLMLLKSHGDNVIQVNSYYTSSQTNSNRLFCTD